MATESQLSAGENQTVQQIESIWTEVLQINSLSEC